MEAAFARLREQELLKLHGEAWLAELPAIEGLAACARVAP